MNTRNSDFKKTGDYVRKFIPKDPNAPAVTRKELAYRLQTYYDLDGALCKEIIASFFEIIRECLLAGEEVRLSSFGTFSVVEKKERPGLNISTREIVIIPARRVVRFKASRKIRMVDVCRYAEAEENNQPIEPVIEEPKTATIIDIIRSVQERNSQ